MWNTFYWIFGALFVVSIAIYSFFARQHRKELQPILDKAAKSSKKSAQ